MTAVRAEYRYIQAMTCTGNRRVRVDPDGRVFADVVTRECASGEDWNGPWPERPVATLTGPDLARLAATIERAGVLDLPSRIDTAGRDGFREELDVTIGDRTHAVTVERAAAPPGFRAVREALLAAARMDEDG